MEKQNANGRWRNHNSLFLFLIAFLAAVCLTLLMKEPGFTDSQVYVLFLFFFAIGLWITEAIPAFAVSLFIMAYLVFAFDHIYLNTDPGDVEIYKRTSAHLLKARCVSRNTVDNDN